jgi:hypothetical protein
MGGTDQKDQLLQMYLVREIVTVFLKATQCHHSQFSLIYKKKNGPYDEHLKFGINFDVGFLVTYTVQCKISGNNNGDNNVRRLKECLLPRQDRQCTYNVAIRHIHATTAAVQKIISTAYSKCVFVAFIIQHAKHKCLIMLSPVTCLVLS